MSLEDLHPQYLLQNTPYERPCFQSELFQRLLKMSLGEHPQSVFNSPEVVDVQNMVIELKEHYFAKWREVPFKQRNISRHLPFTDYSATVVIPPNSQKVRVACFNIFGENLRYFEVAVPKNSFQTKRDLTHVILNDNTELLENLVSDEGFFGDKENPQKMTWFEGISTINIIQNRLGHTSKLNKDIDMAVRLDVVAEDVQNNFSRFPLSQVFEIHRLDLFQGSFKDFFFHPVSNM